MLICEQELSLVDAWLESPSCTEKKLILAQKVLTSTDTERERERYHAKQLATVW